MLYMVNDDNQIVGTLVNPDECPDGFSVVESEFNDIFNVYYDGESIKQKPEKPTDSTNYFWNTLLNKWDIFVSKVTLEIAKQNKAQQLNRECNAFILSGFTSNALGEYYFYGSDNEDQINLIGCVAMGSSVPYVCTNPEGVKNQYLHSASEIRQVLLDGAAIKTNAIYKYRQLINELDLAETIEEVETINW